MVLFKIEHMIMEYLLQKNVILMILIKQIGEQMDVLLHVSQKINHNQILHQNVIQHIQVLIIMTIILLHC